MPSQISITRKCQILKEQCAQLRLQVDAEQRRQDYLLLRHNLLQAWCECLTMVQVNNLTSHHHQQQQQPCASHASWDAALGRQDIELLLDEETRLLSQLTSVAPPNTLDLRGAFDVGVQTIAPPQDPMFYYKRFAFRPPMVNAATMDCQQIGEVMRKAALQIGVHLHLLQDLPAQETGLALERLQHEFDKVLHLSMSLVQVGRQDMVEAVNFLNLQTLQHDVEAATTQAASTAKLIDRLGITPAQQRLIATGSSMYMQLLDAVMHERQHLQTHFAGGGASAPGQCAGGAAGDARVLPQQQQQQQQDEDVDSGYRTRNAGGSNSMHSAGPQPHATDLLEAIEAQQRQALRLQVLLQKEFTLRMAGMCWFIGTLSWQQVAKAVVLCYPFTLRPSLLAKEIQARVEAEAANSSLPWPLGPSAGASS